MRILEDHPFGSQPVHVRRQCLGVALQHARPVIQIIDGNEQDIWFSVLVAGFFSFAVPARYAKQEDRKNENRGLFLCFHSSQEASQMHQEIIR
jgi:hypothetical protein